MIKFFRKIRQKHDKKNRIGKYVLYATGEILLVIVGILIALNINNRNLINPNEAKFEALFKEVNNDLIKDIDETTDSTVSGFTLKIKGVDKVRSYLKIK